MSLSSEYLENIKSFKVYLEHIVKAVESGKYHEVTIKKLSYLIKEYYKKINEEDEDGEDEDEDIINKVFNEDLDYSDVEFIDENSDSEDDKKSIPSVNETNVASDSETSESESEDEESKTNNNDLISNLKSKKNQNSSSVDKYLEDFKSGQIDNSHLYIYKNFTNYNQQLQTFIENSCQY
tara:strand:+ start:3718 stop:4257 length:540 start_codon:yes stop_codon:yes gene_type:complete